MNNDKFWEEKLYPNGKKKQNKNNNKDKNDNQLHNWEENDKKLKQIEEKTLIYLYIIIWGSLSCLLQSMFY